VRGGTSPLPAAALMFVCQIFVSQMALRQRPAAMFKHSLADRRLAARHGEGLRCYQRPALCDFTGRCLHLRFVKSGAGARRRRDIRTVGIPQSARQASALQQSHFGLAGDFWAAFRAKNGPMGRKAWTTKSPPHAQAILSAARFRGLLPTLNAPSSSGLGRGPLKAERVRFP